MFFSPEARILLHYHNKLDHMGFDKLKDLARASYLPSKITKAEKVVCAAFIKDEINEPGDLVHMDQAESSAPGNPLTYSGKNNKNKICIVTLFVNSISRQFFAESQRSTGAKATLNSNHSKVRESKTSGITIKAF